MSPVCRSRISTGDKAKPLYERGLAVERIKAARAAIDSDHSGVFLTGRCEAFLWGQSDLKLVIDRLTAYAEAGADCLYAPGIKTKDEIMAVVKAVHPKPVNLLIGASGLSVKEAEDLGVRRISVGGSLARTAWGRLHARGARDGGAGDVHRTRHRLFRRRTEQNVRLIAVEKKQRVIPAVPVHIASLLSVIVLIGYRCSDLPTGWRSGRVRSRSGRMPAASGGWWKPSPWSRRADYSADYCCWRAE